MNEAEAREIVAAFQSELDGDGFAPSVVRWNQYHEAKGFLSGLESRQGEVDDLKLRLAKQVRMHDENCVRFGKEITEAKAEIERLQFANLDLLAKVDTYDWDRQTLDRDLKAERSASRKLVEAAETLVNRQAPHRENPVLRDCNDCGESWPCDFEKAREALQAYKGTQEGGEEAGG